MSLRAQAILAAIAAWQLVCLAELYIYPATVERAVLAVYAYYYGDVQASFGRYSRVAAYSWIVIATTPATAISIYVFIYLTRSSTLVRRVIGTFVAWQAAVIAALICSYEVGLPFTITLIGWPLFGRLDAYSIVNLVVPRLIAWFICTTPPAVVALWLYGEACGFTIRNKHHREPTRR